MYPAPAPPAAWYADPSGRHQYRYWSGAVWTEHVVDQGRTSCDRLVSGLRPANTDHDWIRRKLWRTWGHPSNSVRGESFRQDAFRRLPGVTPGLIDDVRFEPVEVEFVREPDNPHDRFACKALVSGVHVGYLARECASAMAPQVDAALVPAWRVAGAVVGGSHGARNFGVHVWLDRRLTEGPVWPPGAAPLE